VTALARQAVIDVPLLALGGPCVPVNGRDTWKFEPEVEAYVSVPTRKCARPSRPAAAIGLRDRLMVRAISARSFCEADLKIYLDTYPEIRAKRR
jgi:hypothetical protein